MATNDQEDVRTSRFTTRNTSSTTTRPRVLQASMPIGPLFMAVAKPIGRNLALRTAATAASNIAAPVVGAGALALTAYDLYKNREALAALGLAIGNQIYQTGSRAYNILGDYFFPEENSATSTAPATSGGTTATSGTAAPANPQPEDKKSNEEKPKKKNSNYDWSLWTPYLGYGRGSGFSKFVLKPVRDVATSLIIDLALSLPGEAVVTLLTGKWPGHRSALGWIGKWSGLNKSDTVPSEKTMLKEVTLPDGTKAYINSNTTVSEENNSLNSDSTSFIELFNKMYGDL